MDLKKGLVLVVLLLVLAAAAYVMFFGNKPAGSRITVSGAFALYPMMVKWSEEYQKLHPDVRIDVSAGGAGKGMTDALGGLVDIGMISRDITSEEESKGAVWVSVTKDAVVPTANKDNPMLSELQTKGVKREALKGVWATGEAKTWGDLIGKPGAGGKIVAYTRSDSCGAAEVWGKYLGGVKQEDLRGIGVSSDPGIAEAVRKDALGIGYNNLNYAYDPTTGKPVEGIVVLPIDVDGSGSIEASEDFYAEKDGVVAAIADGRYPSPPARALNIATKGKFSGATQEFVEWILTDGQQYVPETGYVKLSDDELAAQLEKLG